MNKAYKEALAEVNIILENTEEQIINKIPIGFIKFVKANLDDNYKIELEHNKGLVEQKIMKETKQILALIYRDYICTSEERKSLILQEKEEINRIEKEKQEKYNIDFEKILESRQQKNIIDRLEKNSETALIKLPEEKWYNKIINKILRIFKIK